MGRRKLNMFPWSAGLAAVMALLCLIGAVGVSYARYRVDWNEGIFYTPRQPAQVYLGQMVTREDGQIQFDSQAVSSWVAVDNKQRLTFSVANGTSAEDFAQLDQQVQLRLVGSLGIWDGQQTVNVTMYVPREAKPGEIPPQLDTFTAQANRILPDSPLYKTFGDGWVFTFLDEAGEEASWLLEGETLSLVHMSIMIEGVELTDPSLFQLTVTGQYVPEEG